MYWWDFRLALIVLAVVVVLTLIAKGDAVQWQVVPDGPTTFAVVKDYGGKSYWEYVPGKLDQDRAELRICSQVPTQEAAQQIAELLNK
jgi:hypothetical protein